ncbi:MAG: YCF48-related protein [Calditrichia bacterium]
MSNAFVRYICILFFSTLTLGQSISWQWQDPYPINRARGASHFTNSQEGWMGGGIGEVQYTNDGGVTWQRRAILTEQSIHDIEFLDSNTGFAVGSEASIFKTLDGGLTWSQTTLPPSTGFLNEIHFKNAQTGIAVASLGNVIRTTNGGVTWDVIQVGINEDLYGIENFSGDTWHACGTDGTIFKSTDDGLTWSIFQHPTIAAFFNIQFVDALNGWAAGSGGILATTGDGGINWDISFLPMTSWISDIHFNDVSNGWAATGGNSILKTIDGGITWTEVEIDSSLFLSQGINGLVFTDNQTIYLTGDVIYKSMDNGSAWQRLDRELPFSMYTGVYFTTPDSGWVIGRANTDLTYIAHTSNGGQTWETTQLSDFSQPSQGIFFINSQHGWIGISSSVWRTIDGGVNWNSYSLPVTNSVEDILFIDELNGWVITSNGPVLKSNDGGETWITQPIGNEQILALDFSDSQNGWAVGRDGGIYHSTDGGTNWTTQNSNTTEILNDVDFLNPLVGWCVGNEGIILKTVDGGNTWIPENRPVPSFFIQVQVIDENTVWVLDALTNSSVGLTTTADGGNTWDVIALPLFARRSSFSFADPETIFIVGGDRPRNTIYRGKLDLTTGLSTSDFQTLHPGNFELQANYPNPFNPQTTITYTLNKSGNVELAIFNSIGQQLTTLTNERQAAGFYSTTFKADNYPSGTYYYRLKVDGFTQTKGMILVR